MSLHDPVTLPSGLVFPNRLAKAAMAEGLSTAKHDPNDKHFKAYTQWAEGGWGHIHTGNVMVSPAYLGGPQDIQIPGPSTRPEAKAAWEEYAKAIQKDGTPGLVQLCHPGRQGPSGVGAASFFEKRVSASDVPLKIGNGIVASILAKLLFGTPRPLTKSEIQGPDGIIAQFVAGAVQSYKAGFKGIVLHGAHGYLLSQFMSPATNKRTDDYGGTAAKRARIVVEIIEAVRAATSKQFAIGIKLNSVDASQSESSDEVVEQVGLIVGAGIDFIEVSGGTYENPVMTGYKHEGPDKAEASPSSTTGYKPSTKKREAYFLEFTALLRQHYPKTVLMVTGGFRTRAGMQEAIESGACDLIGIGRPATVMPHLPKDIILNDSLPEEKAHIKLTPTKKPWWLSLIPVTIIGAGWDTIHYTGELQKLGA